MISIKIGIVDYELGNHDSLFYSLKSIGFSVFISNNPDELKICNIILLPGVGAFPKAMKSLRKSGLDKFIIEWAKLEKPIIGICLGMQLICTKSYEFKECSGLNLINGEIIKMENNDWHIGWNSNIPSHDNKIFRGLKRSQFYYNHSFKFYGDSQNILSETELNNEIIPAIIKKGKTFGIQFHPEKSQLSGKILLTRIIKHLLND